MKRRLLIYGKKFACNFPSFYTSFTFDPNLIISMKRQILLILIVFNVVVSFAQCIEGKITDTKNNPIAFATIFCESLSKGTTSNIEGYYKLDFPKGNHVIIVRYLGYKTKEFVVQCSAETQHFDIVLEEQAYKIPEVRVMASGEDPAYSIMRKAIAMSYYYLNQAEEYNCRVYLKGSGMLVKAPKLLKKKLEKEGLEEGKSMVIENITDLHFKLPNTIEEKVISIRSSDNTNDVSPMSYITLSLYQDNNGVVSPLGKDAFSYYKFQLAASFYDQDYLVHKIKVIPNRTGFDVYSGYIYIVEGFWHLHSAELKLEQKMFTIDINQIYSPVDKDVWMPVSHDFDIVIKAIGGEFRYRYVASVSNFKVKLNSALDHSIYKNLLTESKELAEQEKEINNSVQNQIKNLTQKESLSKSESKKLKKLIKKDVEKSIPEKELELKESYTLDDSAELKTVSYWDSIRPIPLTISEKSSYKVKDSIEIKVEKNPLYLDSLKRDKYKFTWRKLLLGGTYEFSEKQKFSYGGLFGLTNYNYNTVDGFKYQTYFNYKLDNLQGKLFNITQHTAYAFARERMTSYFNIDYRYNGIKRAYLSFEGGRNTVDFNETSGISNNLNLITTLLLKENYQKLYQKDYANIGHKFDIVNGLILNTQFEYAQHSEHVNHSDFYFFDPYNKDFTSNIPQADNLSTNLISKHDASVLKIGITYTPQYFYKIKDGVKQMEYSIYPTFELNYKKGINDFLGSDVDYDLLDLTIKQSISTQRLGTISYNLTGGTFLNTNKMYFADYKHFGTNSPFLISSSDYTSFRTLNYYENSTNTSFIEGHVRLVSNRILLKRIPGLNKTLMNENIYLNYLATNGNKPYYEVGYGLNQIFLMFNVEVFAGFEGSQYKYTCLKIGIPFLNKKNDSITIGIN